MLSLITATALSVMLYLNLLTLNGSYPSIVVLTVVSVAIAALNLNETLMGIVNKRRDLAILLAVGCQRHVIGLILAGKPVLYASLSCLLGLFIGHSLIARGDELFAFPLSSVMILFFTVILGPTVFASVYGLLYTFRLNVPEVLRQ